MIKEKTKSVKFAKNRVRHCTLTEELERVARELDKIHKGKKWLTEDVNEYLTRKYLNRTQRGLMKVVLEQRIKENTMKIAKSDSKAAKLKKELKKLTEEIIDF